MEKIKEAGRTVARPIGVLGAMLSVLLLGALAMAGSASATPADPAEAAFGDMETKAGVYGAAAVGLVVAVALIFFGIKMFKRGASKA